MRIGCGFAKLNIFFWGAGWLIFGTVFRLFAGDKGVRGYSSQDTTGNPFPSTHLLLWRMQHLNMRKKEPKLSFWCQGFCDFRTVNRTATHRHTDLKSRIKNFGQACPIFGLDPPDPPPTPPFRCPHPDKKGANLLLFQIGIHLHQCCDFTP